MEQSRRGAAEDVGFLLLAERRRSKNVVGGMQLPGIGIVAAEDDRAGADLGHQMADRLGGEDQGVKIDLLEIFRRLLCKLHVRVAALGTDQAGMIRTIGVGGQEAAAMGSNHSEPGKAIERAFENEMRERNRGLQRIADGVEEPAIAVKPLVQFRYALRMD